MALIWESVKLSKAGREYEGLCPFHSERTPSFRVTEAKGFYHCFGCGAHGDVFEWMMIRGGLTFREALEELAVRAGLQADREGRKRPELAPIVERPSKEDLDEERLQKIADARDIWNRGGPAKGTLLETYLGARGIRLPPPPSLRFVLSWNYEVQRALPVMVAAVQGPARSINGVHRTFLASDGSGNAQGLKKNKLMLGDCWGGSVRLAHAGRQLLVGEGIETTLSVMQATGLPGWAALSQGNMAAIVLPPIVREVVLCRDNDSKAKDQEGRDKLFEKAMSFHAGRGLRGREALPPKGCDFNDVLVGAGQNV